MLILTRRAGEAVIITENEDVIMRVISIHKGVVKIAFDAPPHIKIDREEIYERKKNGEPLVAKEPKNYNY